MTAHSAIKPSRAADALAEPPWCDRAKALVGPFIGAQVNPPRDPNSKYGAYLPRLAAIDILAPGVEYGDACIYAASDEGVRVRGAFGTETVAWNHLQGIRIRSMGRDGRWTDGTLFAPRDEAEADRAYRFECRTGREWNPLTMTMGGLV